MRVETCLVLRLWSLSRQYTAQNLPSAYEDLFIVHRPCYFVIHMLLLPTFLFRGGRPRLTSHNQVSFLVKSRHIQSKGNLACDQRQELMSAEGACNSGAIQIQITYVFPFWCGAHCVMQSVTYLRSCDDVGKNSRWKNYK